MVNELNLSLQYDLVARKGDAILGYINRRISSRSTRILPLFGSGVTTARILFSVVASKIQAGY